LERSLVLKLVFHEDCLTPYFTSVAESPLRLKAIHGKLKDCYETVVPEPASREDVLRVHTTEHVARVQIEDPEVFTTALMAAGGAVCAATLAASGQPAFALVRPPGHHAGRSRYGAFCFFNNVAVALSRLQESGCIGSAAIVDFDMHRADGTADIFAEDKSVHLIDVYARDREKYLHRLQFELARLPKVDMVAVCAGFDLYVKDWGGLLETEDFHLIGSAVRDTAMRKADGRWFAVLEGGYYLDDLPRNALAFCSGICAG
jgi:acetoin utilization deacetylase AcuC-like enzyme